MWDKTPSRSPLLLFFFTFSGQLLNIFFTLLLGNYEPQGYNGHWPLAISKLTAASGVPDGLCGNTALFTMDPFQQSMEVKCWRLIRDRSTGQNNLRSNFAGTSCSGIFKRSSDIEALIYFCGGLERLMSKYSEKNGEQDMRKKSVYLLFFFVPMILSCETPPGEMALQDKLQVSVAH